ncbi:MAG: hypothetical protein EOO13_00790 [Chitinophagaceae bacterium]|nr:MAG: hypothetical protein EOO13_00790 [Chitinophagaceae bacterium]
MLCTKSLLILLLGIPLFGDAQVAIMGRETVLDEKIGDLDRDGMEERVLVVSFPDSTGQKDIRELRILKRQGRGWIIWHRSLKAILQPEEGGSFGDPFEYIEIDKGLLTVRQSGGNAWKWGQTDKYRYQHGRFELVGYTSFYGKPCEYWADFAYNVTTRQVSYKKEYEKCSLKKGKKPKKDKENFRYRMKKKLTLESRYEKYTTIICPRLKQEIVF